MKTLRSTRRRLTLSFLTLAMASIAAGCSWPGPHLQHNLAVESHFDAFQIYPQYQYYTAGNLNDPRAILALKPGYTLESPGWQTVDMTPELLAQWIAAFKEDSFVDGNVFPDGAAVIGYDGELAGHYYSVWEYPVVRVPKEMTIAQAVPDADYRRHNEKIKDFLYGGDDGRNY